MCLVDSYRSTSFGKFERTYITESVGTDSGSISFENLQNLLLDNKLLIKKREKETMMEKQVLIMDKIWKNMHKLMRIGKESTKEKWARTRGECKRPGEQAQGALGVLACGRRSNAKKLNC